MGTERESDEKKYCRLTDVKISFDSVAREEGEENRGFSLCFWIYLSNSAQPCTVVLHQTNPTAQGDIPFVALDEESKLIIFPLLGLHEEAPGPDSFFPWRSMTHLSASNACPMERWVHIGCQVTQKYMCLHINGIMVAGMNLGSLSNGKNQRDSLKFMTLVGNKGKVEGYFYNSQVLPSPVSIKSQYTKDQPVRLFLDSSSLPDGVEAGPDGVWSIVGGKPSCRRNFTLEVLLVNGMDQPVYRDMEIMASLVYADNGALVEKSKDDGEDPLLLSCDGVEYPSTNRPVPLVRGRAAFKLKMAQGLNEKMNNSDGAAESSPLSDSDSKGANEVFERRLGDSSSLSDSMVFRYCLEGTRERLIILRETLSTTSDDDMADFAKRVGLYTGCSHHGYQILMAKKLIEEGNETWATISFDKTRVLWTCAIPEIVKKFTCLTHSKHRGLSGEDIEVLRGIAGCSEEMGREDFERLWYWMYPVALTLARERINKLWDCLIPKWIEGFITKEEAENVLTNPKGPERPGTFLLRFPTTRSWPHPDAGNLVISYVGSDSMVHHKLLALNYSDERGELQNLLLEEPELTQLARVTHPEVYS